MTQRLNPIPERHPSDAVLDAWEEASEWRKFSGEHGPTRIDFEFGRAHERLLRFEAYERTRDSEPERPSCTRT